MDRAMTVDPRVEAAAKALMAEFVMLRPGDAQLAARLALAAADAVEGDRAGRARRAAGCGCVCGVAERYVNTGTQEACTCSARFSGGGVEPSREDGLSPQVAKWKADSLYLEESEARVVELEAALRAWLKFDNDVEPPKDGAPYEEHVAYETAKFAITERAALAAAGEGGTCHEDMGSDPCGKPAVGERIDPDYGEPYPVCSRHLRPPFTVTEAAGEGEGR